MAKYSRKAGEKVERAMRERKRGTLRSGSGRKVKSRKQAIAIGLSEARRSGAKVPNAGSRKASSRKSASRKAASTKSSSSRKSPARKTSTRKSAAAKKR